MLPGVALDLRPRVIAFLKLGRPQFLLGGLVFYSLGTALGWLVAATFDWRAYVWGQAVITSTQLMTHYSNDYFDLAADRANTTPTRWSGGSRVLLSGVLAPQVARLAALVLCGCAVGLALGLALRPSSPPLVLPLALAMIFLAWSYSAPPLRLLARGLGELTTAVVVTLLTPLFGFYLQRGAFSWLPLLASLPLCTLQLVMLLTIELPDAAGDAAVGKRTLIVRWVAAVGARVGAWLIVVTFVGLPVLVRWGLPAPIAVATAVLAPVAAWQALRLWRDGPTPGAPWESLAEVSVALLFLSALAELVAALILIRSR